VLTAVALRKRIPHVVPDAELADERLLGLWTAVSGTPCPRHQDDDLDGGFSFAGLVRRPVTCTPAERTDFDVRAFGDVEPVRMLHDRPNHEFVISWVWPLVLPPLPGEAPGEVRPGWLGSGAAVAANEQVRPWWRAGRCRYEAMVVIDHLGEASGGLVRMVFAAGRVQWSWPPAVTGDGYRGGGVARAGEPGAADGTVLIVFRDDGAVADAVIW
jgi:hypothetical protein